MTRTYSTSQSWAWKGIRDPETGGRTQITLTAECLDGHIFPKHLRSGQQPWRAILGAELANTLRCHYAESVTDIHRLRALLEDASMRLEEQIRSGLEHPMVVLYRAGNTESQALRNVDVTWCVLTPSGAEAYVRAHFVCTVYFNIGLSRLTQGWGPSMQARIAAMSLRAVARGQPMPSGAVDTGVAESAHRYRVDLRFESERNWAEMKMPELQPPGHSASEDQR